MVMDYPRNEEKKNGSQKMGRKVQAYASALLWTLTGTTMANTSYRRIAKAYIAKKK